jgi:UDP-N-acetyl-D-mannosaminuronic acid transferase (WecB/TagA/CpsF family)
VAHHIRAAGGELAAHSPDDVLTSTEQEDPLAFVALPSPMKEDFIYGFREAMNVGLSVGVGGSFDVVAGRTRRRTAGRRRAVSQQARSPSSRS